jgi:hypothetical protein
LPFHLVFLRPGWARKKPLIFSLLSFLFRMEALTSKLHICWAWAGGLGKYLRELLFLTFPHGNLKTILKRRD